MIITGQSMRDLFTGYQASFNTGFRDAPVDYTSVATVVASSTAENHYAWLGQWKKLREWIGDRQYGDMATHDYTIKNKKYEASQKISRDVIEDDQYGIFAPMFQEMGYAAKQHPDEIVFPLLTNGFNLACYDKQPFFDLDHPVGLGRNVTSVGNMQAGGNPPWFLLCTKRPLKPLIFQMRRPYNLRALTSLDDSQVFDTDEFKFGIDARANSGYGFWQLAFASQAPLNQANYEAARAAMRGWLSDEGRPLNIKPDLLVCGPSNQAAANSTIAVQRLAGGADNPNWKDVDILVTGQLI